MEKTVILGTWSGAQTAFGNSGWFERLPDATDDVARFLRAECSANRVTAAELETLLQRYAVERAGWKTSDL